MLSNTRKGGIVTEERVIPDQWSALADAQEAGNLDQIRSLASAGIDIDTKDAYGATALMKACLWDQRDVVGLLLELQADVNVRDSSFGSTALIFAALAGNLEIAQLLLAHGANPNAATRVGGTALMAASRANHKRIVDLLLDHAADPSRRDKRGFTALIEAAREGSAEAVSSLLAKGKGCDVNAADVDERSALFWAGFKGHAEVVRQLLKVGAVPDLPDKDGNTALIWACFRDHLEVITLLLECGADVNCQTSSGYSPLLAATGAGHIDAVRLLLEWGADIDSTNHNGYTAWFVARAGRRTAIMHTLLLKHLSQIKLLFPHHSDTSSSILMD
jgi:uncharacterized protein